MQTDPNMQVFTLDELRGIIRPLSEQFGMRSASIFGSYARGEADALSDIDVLVDKGDSRAINIFGVAEGISAITGKEVDIFDISQLLPGDFRDVVLSEAVPV